MFFIQILHDCGGEVLPKKYQTLQAAKDAACSMVDRQIGAYIYAHDSLEKLFYIDGRLGELSVTKVK